MSAAVINHQEERRGDFQLTKLVLGPVTSEISLATSRLHTSRRDQLQRNKHNGCTLRERSLLRNALLIHAIAGKLSALRQPLETGVRSFQFSRCLENLGSSQLLKQAGVAFNIHISQTLGI